MQNNIHSPITSTLTNSMPHNPSLWQNIQDYQNEDVCNRFARDQKVSPEFAQLAFLEMKRFLYIALISRQSCSPSKIIDEMWHIFIIYTHSYRTFCQTFNGSYMDHIPSDKPNITGYINTQALTLKIFGELNELFWPNPSSPSFADCSTCDSCSCNVVTTTLN